MIHVLEYCGDPMCWNVVGILPQVLMVEIITKICE